MAARRQWGEGQARVGRREGAVGESGPDRDARLGRFRWVRTCTRVKSFVHVWMAPTLQGLSRVLLGVACGHVSGLRCGRGMTAGPDGFRGARPQQFGGLADPLHEPGFPRSLGRPIHHHAFLPSQALSDPNGAATPPWAGIPSRGASPPRRCAPSCSPVPPPRPFAAAGRAAPAATGWPPPPWASAAPPGRR